MHKPGICSGSYVRHVFIYWLKWTFNGLIVKQLCFWNVTSEQSLHLENHFYFVFYLLLPMAKGSVINKSLGWHCAKHASVHVLLVSDFWKAQVKIHKTEIKRCLKLVWPSSYSAVMFVLNIFWPHRLCCSPRTALKSPSTLYKYILYGLRNGMKS